ncbi:MAG TPA: sigma factor, partial [Nitrolancea sp.]|nr:sigma factor [Nitrolancea sp.]
MAELVQAVSTAQFAAVATAERSRLVRLCAHLSGNAEAAEDLAQETLTEAWRQRHKLYDLDGMGRWLSVIARYICLRWAQRAGRDSVHSVPLANEADALPAPDIDFDVALER